MKYVLLMLLLIPIASAHLEGGADKVVGDYLVDFGYSPGTPIAGDKMLIAINLVNNSEQTVITPESVWVRISNGNDVIFAGRFHPEAKHVTFSFSFPKPGNYTIDTRFVHGSNPETSFNVLVGAKKEKPSEFMVLGVGALLAIIGIIFYFTFIKKN